MRTTGCTDDCNARANGIEKLGQRTVPASVMTDFENVRRQIASARDQRALDLDSHVRGQQRANTSRRYRKNKGSIVARSIVPTGFRPENFDPDAPRATRLA